MSFVDNKSRIISDLRPQRWALQPQIIDKWLADNSQNVPGLNTETYRTGMTAAYAIDSITPVDNAQRFLTEEDLPPFLRSMVPQLYVNFLTRLHWLEEAKRLPDSTQNATLRTLEFVLEKDWSLLESVERTHAQWTEIIGLLRSQMGQDQDLKGSFDYYHFNNNKVGDALLAAGVRL